MTERRTMSQATAAPRSVALLLGLLSALIGASVLAGWVLDIPFLRSGPFAGNAMRANGAIAMILCGTALACLAAGPAALRMIAGWAGALVAVFAGATLLQDLGGWDFGIDQALMRDPGGATRFALPGRVSPPTAFCFLLLGAALAVAALSRQWRLRSATVQALGTTVVLVGGIALLGHASERLLEIRLLSYSRVSTYAALGLLLLGAGLFLLMRGEGAVRWSLDAATTLGFAAGVLAMVVTAGVSYQFTSNLRGDAAEVSRTMEVLKEIQRLNVVLSDFTLSAGRYIITRDEKALAGREATIASIRTSLARLKELATVEEQLARLERIEQLHARRIEMSEDIIAKFRARISAGDLARAGEPSPLGLEYPALGVQIEQLTRELEAAAHATLERRQARADATARTTFLLLPLGVFVGLAVLMLGLMYLNAGAADRRRDRDALAKKTKRLEFLHGIDVAIIAATSPAEIAAAALPRLRDLMGLPRVVVNLLDLTKNEAEWLAAVGRRRTHVGPGVRFPAAFLGDAQGLRRGEMQLIDVSSLEKRAETEALLASDVRWYMVIPMIAGGELIGGLSFGGPSREFPAEQLEIAREAAAQLAIAIAQSRLGRRANRADALNRLVFSNVPVGITVTGADGVVISANEQVVRMLGYDTLDEALAAIGGRARTVYADPAERERYVSALQKAGSVRGMELQLVRKDGSCFWASLDGSVAPIEPGGAPVLITTIDDITGRREQGHRIERLSRVKEMQSGINSAVVRIRDRQALLNEVCRIAVEKGGLRAAWIGWHDAEGKRVEPVASSGKIDGFLDLVDLTTDGPPDRLASPSARVLFTARPEIVNDLGADDEYAFRDGAVERGFLSMMHLPLVVAGAPLGVLVLYAPEAGFFDAEETALLEELAADVSFALESLHKSERLDYLAYYDPVTGLPNRSLFRDRLSHSLHARGGEQRMIAVVLLDLERFRRVNETLGRSRGDDLLREVGGRLHRANDTVAHIGADMFGLVLRGARSVAEINRALEAIVGEAFSTPFLIGGDELRVACRAGVSVHPNDGADADGLLKNAEAALRRSKGVADRIVFYAPDMNARVAEALAIENRLRRAVERRQFVLHYQPKVALSGGAITGLEALIRWQDPDTGLVPPGRFIPILEETGLIVEAGRWALQQALSDAVGWAARGIRVPRIAVNVSAVQMDRRDYVDTVIDEIARGGDNPDWLELEITESLVMHNVEDTTRKLAILRGMGVTVAIDDFGTGYSSLSYLGRLPVDSLKIDKSFIAGVADKTDAATVVSTIIALAHGLKLKVVAEGVETKNQADLLRLLRCDEAQGYLYSRPIPAAEIEPMLRGGVLHSV